ncbi:MAG TPA: protein kinase [Kofleriaceae bacterium]
MGANDEGGEPPPKRTQYGIAVTPQSGVPAVPAPQRPVATPQPPATQKTQFGVPLRKTPQPMRVPMPSGSQVAPTGPATKPALSPEQSGFQQTRYGSGVIAPQPSPTPPPTTPAATPQPSQGHATTGTRAQQHTSNPRPPHDLVASAVGIEAGARIHQYELIRELGRGGMGMVWAARDTKLGRRVAIKFLLDASRDVADRFLTEARATAQCNHENIVIIHEVDELESMPYMVLEFLEGQELRDLMGAFNAGPRMPASRLVELMLPVARALERAHELGIVHRDLKPENVFVTNAGQVKVLDFGIAKAISKREVAQVAQVAPQLHDMASMNLNLTREGTLVGTLPYMSPEQMGIGDVDHRADIWAAGIIMWELLSGHHPIEPLTNEALITNAVSDHVMPSLREEVPDLPDALVQIVDDCLRKRAIERIPNARELVNRLEQLLPGRGGRQLAEGESPYPGLTAFQEADADRFFGRSRDIARMTARIREYPITGIVGPSGVGKSSFIRAGVGPALKASGERWDVVTLRPGRQPLAALASIVQRLTTRSGPSVQTRVDEHHQIMHRLRSEPGYVGTLLRSRARQTNGQILLFIDQFEELYTLVPDADERKAFTAALAGVADDTAAPLRVVVSMRSDFLDRIAEDPRFMEEMSRGLVFLQPPDRNGLREALEAPIDMVGYRFESSAMIEDMLDALAGAPGALPLLQFAAAKLWDARDRQRRLLTVQSYNAIGGISGALATHADDVVAQMNDRQQKLTQKIFRRLVTEDRTRAIVELADLYQLAGDQTEVARTIDQLVSARLLIVQTRGDAGGGSVEIVHESLIDRWPTLRRWLDEDQEDAAFMSQLQAAAKQWDTKRRPAGLLWRGDAMEEARRWHNHRKRELPAREQAFLHAAFALARRGKRAKRAALFATFIVLGGVAAAASVGLVMIRAAEQEASDNATRATENAARAEHEAKIAKQALEEREKKEAERLAAEEKQKVAEADKAKIEAEKVQVEAQKEQAETKVAESAEELKKKNRELEAKIAEVEKAKARAESAKLEAQTAKSDVDRINKKLEAEIKELKKGGLVEKLK